MRKIGIHKILAVTAGLALLAVAGTASAAPTTMETCSAQYKADKAAGKVKEGTKWTQYYKDCAASLKKASGNDEKAPSEPKAADLKTPLATKDKNGKAYTPAQIAMHKRIRECATTWNADKAAHKIKAGETWPKYWSACNAKLKKAGQ